MRRFRIRGWSGVVLAAGLALALAAWLLVGATPGVEEVRLGVRQDAEPEEAPPEVRLGGGAPEGIARRRPMEGEAEAGGVQAEAGGAEAQRVVVVQVRESSRGASVADAHVLLTPLGTGDKVESQSDAEGAARARVPEGLPFVVDVHPPAGTGHRLVASRRFVPGPGRYEVVLPLVPALVVRVVDETGRPPAEAVRLSWRPVDAWRRGNALEGTLPGPARGGAVVLGPEGTVSLALSDVAWGFIAQGVAEDTELLYTYVAPIDVHAGEATIRMVHGGERVRFRVVDPATGEPPPGTVKYRLCAAGRPFENPCAHGQAGASALASRPLAPGRYDVHVSHHDASDRRLGWGVARGLLAGGPVQTIELEPGAELSGIVLDEEGLPVEDPVELSVFFDSEGPLPDTMSGLAHGTSSEGGRFRFRGLPPGALRLEASRSARAGWATLRGLRDVHDPIVLRLEPRMTLRGRIACPGWSAPYTGDVRCVYGKAPLEADGSFCLPRMPPGSVPLSWWVGTVRVADLGDVTAPGEGVVVAVPSPWTR